MAVAIAAAWWPDVDSPDALLGLPESAYLAIFAWLALAGAGVLSIDYALQRRYGRAAQSPTRAWKGKGLRDRMQAFCSRPFL